MVTRKLQRKISSLYRLGMIKREIGQMVSTRRTLPDGRVIKVIPLPITVPYVKELIRTRTVAFRNAKRQGIVKTRQEWDNFIIESVYVANNYLKEDGRIDFWQMLRNWEERYKEKFPEYDSPYKEKKKKMKDFDDKWKRGAEKARNKKEQEAIDKRNREQEEYKRKYGIH